MSNTRIVYAGGHCHAPACVSIELYENKSGIPNLICRQLPKYGKGNTKVDKYVVVDNSAPPFPSPFSFTVLGGGGGLKSILVGVFEDTDDGPAPRIKYPLTRVALYFMQCMLTQLCAMLMTPLRLC